MPKYKQKITYLQPYKDQQIYLNEETERYHSGNLEAFSLKELRKLIDKYLQQGWKRQPCFTTGRHGYRTIVKGHVTKASPDRDIFAVSFDLSEEDGRGGHEDGVHLHHIYAPSPKNKRLANEIQTLQEVIDQCEKEIEDAKGLLEPFVMSKENETINGKGAS